MKARGPVLAGLAVAVIAVSAAVFWPSLMDTARHRIEGRLREETGRDWRIEGVGLGLSPGPQIVLTNLAFGDDRAESRVLGGRVREVRLSDPVSLVLGGGRSGRLIAESVSLRAPLAGEPGAKADLPAGGAFRVVARGADAGLGEAGKAVFASARTLEVEFDLGKTERAEIRGSVELPASTATVSFDGPAAGQPAGVFSLGLEPRDPKGLRIAAKAGMSLRSSVLRLDALSGTIDGAPFGGTVEIGWDRPKPRLVLDARLDALTLTDEAAADRIGGSAQGGLVVPVTPDTIPDVRWFSDFDATGSVAIGRLTLGPTRLEKVAVTGTVKNGGLDAALSSASGYGGSARGRYVLAPEADGAGRHQLGFSLNRMQVLPLLADIAGARGIDGTGTLRVDLQAKGAEIAAVRGSLSGSADLTITEGRIDGLDIAGAVGLIPSNGAGRGALATRLDRLAGSFGLTEGQAVSNDLELKTSLIEAKGIGSINMIHRTLDVHLKPQVVAPGAARQDRARNPLDVAVRVSGPWSNPAVSADLSGIAANPSGALESLQDLGAGILGDENMDVGGALGGLLEGLLGRSDRGAPGGAPGRRAPRPLDADPEAPR